MVLWLVVLVEYDGETRMLWKRFLYKMNWNWNLHKWEEPNVESMQMARLDEWGEDRRRS